MKKLAFTMAGGGQAAPIFGCMARRVAFTMADRLSRLYTLVPSRSAFTMAEILLSLTIIGVVAAITLPSLMGNINERTWNTQRKALHARMSQAIAMMPQVHGYGGLSVNEEDWSFSGDNGAEVFITDGLSKVLKINNICDSENLADCGLASTVNKINGGVAWSSIPKTTADYNENLNFFYNQDATGLFSTKTAAFETQNGESILLMYNPRCVDYHNLNQIVAGSMCANLVYDLNGNKGPNTFGKDIGFISVFNGGEHPTVVAPMLVSNEFVTFTDYSDMSKVCAAKDPESRAPNYEEAGALMANSVLFGEETIDSIATKTKVGTNGNYWVVMNPANFIVAVTSDILSNSPTMCVKR